jgi:hypothetical protein
MSAAAVPLPGGAVLGRESERRGEAVTGKGNEHDRGGGRGQPITVLPPVSHHERGQGLQPIARRGERSVDLAVRLVAGRCEPHAEVEQRGPPL